MIWLQGIQGVLCIYEIGMLFYILHAFMLRRLSNKKYTALLFMSIFILSSITIYQRYIAGMYSRYYLIVISVLASLLSAVLYRSSWKNILLITLLYFENIYLCDLFILFGISYIIMNPEFAGFVQFHVSTGRIFILLFTRIIVYYFV